MEDTEPEEECMEVMEAADDFPERELEELSEMGINLHIRIKHTLCMQIKTFRKSS